MIEQQVFERPIEQVESPRPATPVSTSLSERRKLLRVLLPIAVVAAAVVVWRVAFAGRVAPGVVELSGRIEGDDSAVAAKTSGRILEMRVREGDSVKASDIVAVLDDQQVRAREDQAREAVTGAEAREKAGRQQISVLQEQLRQSELQTDQTETDAQGRVKQAEADLAAAEADLAQQEATYQLAVFDRDAYTRLAQTGAVSERQGKQAVATADQQEAAVAAGKRRVEAARGALTTAKANLANTGIRGSQTTAVRKQIAQQQAEIASAAASAQQMRARQSLGLTRQRFEAGVTENVEVVQSEESVASADLDYINAIFAHNLAKLSLARAMGRAEESLPKFLK